MDGTEREPEMQEMSEVECYEALSTHSVGRIGVIVDQYPLLIPVNYLLDGDSIVIRTAPGTTLSHATGQRVTFQVDEFHADTKSGWSVLILGDGRIESADDASNAAANLIEARLAPWAPGERPLWIRIRVARITGRRIDPGTTREWRMDSTAYL